MAASQDPTNPSIPSKHSEETPDFVAKGPDPVWDPLIEAYTNGTPAFTYAGPGGKELTAFFELVEKPSIPTGQTSCMACRKTLKWFQCLVGPDGILLDVRILEGLSSPLDAALFTPNPNSEVKTIRLRPPSHVVVGRTLYTKTPYYGNCVSVTEKVQKWIAEHGTDRVFTHIPVTDALDGNDPELTAILEKLVQGGLPQRIIAWLKASVGSKDDVAYLTILADAINTADAASYPHLRLPIVVGELGMIINIISTISTGAPNGVSAMTPIQLYDLALQIICPTIGGGVMNPVCLGWKIFQHLLYALERVAEDNPDSGGQADILRCLNDRFNPATRGIEAAAKARSDHAVQEACIKDGWLVLTIAGVWGIPSPDGSIPPLSGKDDLDFGAIVTNLTTGDVSKITYSTAGAPVTMPGVEGMLDFDNTGKGGTCVENITLKFLLSKPEKYSIRVRATVWRGSNTSGKYIGVELGIPQPDGSCEKTAVDISCPLSEGKASENIDSDNFFPVRDPIYIDTGDYQALPPQPEMSDKELRRLEAQAALVEKCFGPEGMLVTDFDKVSLEPEPASSPSSFGDLLGSRKPAKAGGLPRLAGLAAGPPPRMIDLNKRGQFACILKHSTGGDGILGPFKSLVFLQQTSDRTCKATLGSLVPPGTPPHSIPDIYRPPRFSSPHGGVTPWTPYEVKVLASIETGTKDVPGPQGTLYVVQLQNSPKLKLIGRGLHHSDPAFRRVVGGVDISHALRGVIAHMNGLGENFVRETENPAIGVWIPADAPPEDHPQPVRPKASVRWSTGGAPRPTRMDSAASSPTPTRLARMASATSAPTPTRLARMNSTHGIDLFDD